MARCGVRMFISWMWCVVLNPSALRIPKAGTRMGTITPGGTPDSQGSTMSATWAYRPDIGRRDL